MLENCSDFPAVWRGLAKAGMLTALINTNLQGEVWQPFVERFDDPIWFLEPGAGTYVPFGPEHTQRLSTGGYRL